MSKFNFNNIKGLTANDRELWEKLNINLLKGKGYFNESDPQKEIIFKNVAFKNKFGDREDYNEFFNKHSSEQRDSLLNIAYGGIKPIEDPRLTMQLDTFSNQRLSSAENIARDLEYKAKNDSLIVDPIVNSLKNRYSNEIILRSKEFDSIAVEKSNLYKNYKDTDYLNLDQQSKAELLAEYEGLRRAFGEERANFILNAKILDIVAKNQSGAEKLWNGFKGMGANALATAAIFGSALYSANKTLLEYLTDNENPDLNLLQNFTDNLANNTLGKWGADVLETKALLPKFQEMHKKNGTKALNIFLSNEEENNPLGHLLSVGTAATLMDSYGFTLASSIGSVGISGFLQAGAKKGIIGASKIAAKQALKRGDDALLAATKVTESLTKASKNIIPFMTTTLTATGEAGVEGILNYRDVMRDSFDSVDKLKNQLIQLRASELMEGYLVDASGNVQIKQGDKIITVSLKEASNLALKQAEYDVENEHGDDFKDFYKKGELEALSSGGRTFMVNQIFNGILDSSLKLGWLAPSVQKGIKQTRLGRIMYPEQKQFKQVGSQVVASKNIGGTALKSLYTVAGEGIQESGLETVTGVHSKVAENNMEKFIEHRLNGLEDYVNSIGLDLNVASSVFWDTLTDKNTIVAGVHGALGAAIGGVNLNARYNKAKRLSNESFIDYAKRRTPITWKSPMAGEVKDALRDYKESKKVAETINTMLKDPVIMDKFKGGIGTLNWANDMLIAAENNDEFTYRNSMLGKTVNDIITLNKIKGTKIYDSILNELNTVANATENSPVATLIITSVQLAIPNKGLDINDKDALLQAKKGASKMLEVIESVNKESDAIDRLLGSNISDDAKQALIFNKLAMKDWNDRLSKINQEVSNIKFPEVLDETSTPIITKEKQLAVARLGSLSNVTKVIELSKSLIKQLESEIKELLKEYSKTKDDTLGKVITMQQSLLNGLKQRLKQAKSDTSILEDTDIVLSALLIVNLPPVERALMLKEENRENYSKEQQQIINDLINVGTLEDAEFESKIRDASKIQVAKNKALINYKRSITDPTNLNEYSLKFRNKVAIHEFNKSLENINQIKDYPTFKLMVDDIMEEESPSKEKMMDETFKNNPFYQKYKKVTSLEKSANKIMDSRDFNDESRTYTNALFKELADNDIDPEDETAVTEYFSQTRGGYDNAMADITTLNNVMNVYRRNNELKNRMSVVTKEVIPPKSTTGLIENDPNTELTDVDEEVSPEDVPKEWSDLSTKTEERENLLTDVNNIVNNFVSDFDDIKPLARQIIEGLKDYDTAELLADAIKGISLNYYNKKDVLSSRMYFLLQQAATSLLIQRDKFDVSNADKTFHSVVKSLDVQSMRNQETQAKRYAPIIKYYEDLGIEEFLLNNSLENKKILFISDPILNETLKTHMGNDYSEDHQSLIAVVEVKDGLGIRIGNKNYQPVGIMSGTTSNFLGAMRLAPIRAAIKNQEVGKIIRNVKGEPFTIKGKSNIETSKHLSIDVGLRETLMNDLHPTDRKILQKQQQSDNPLKNRKTIYDSAKEKIISMFKVNTSTSGDTGDRALFMKIPGVDKLERVLVKPISKSSVRDGSKSVLDVLNNGSPSEIININSKTSGYVEALKKIFDSNPFSLDQSPESIISIENKLNEKLGRFLNIGGFLYKLSINSFENGNYTYKLSLNGINEEGVVSYPLGIVSNLGITDPIGASILKNLILDGTNIRLHKKLELIKWDVNFGNFSDIKNNSNYVNKVIDDDLLYTNRKTFKSTPKGLDLIFEQLKPSTITPVITIKDNAVINTPTIVKDELTGEKLDDNIPDIPDFFSTITEEELRILAGLLEQPTTTVKFLKESIELSQNVSNAGLKRFNRAGKIRPYSELVYEVFDTKELLDLMVKLYGVDKLNSMHKEELEHAKGCL